MKVLFVYKFLTVGGVETVLRARLHGLASHGIEAHCWFFADYGGSTLFTDVPDRLHVGTPEEALAFVRQARIDLVSTIDTEEVLPGLERMVPRPVVVLEAHSAYLENLHYLASLAPTTVRSILVPSASHGRLIAERTGGLWPVDVAPNPVAEPFLVPVEPAAAPHGVPLVAWLGRLDDHKNWKSFLRIAGQLRQWGVDAEFVVAGHPVEPSGVDDLRATATAQSILPRLRWLCSLPHARVPDLLDDVRESGGAVVVTSRGESFGMTVVEAMARACPVVVPQSAPYDEVIAWGTSGECYPPGDTTDAARVVAELLAEPLRGRRLGAVARQVVLERFTPEVTAASLATRLRAALAAPPDQTETL